jgi:hypothetical protein
MLQGHATKFSDQVQSRGRPRPPSAPSKQVGKTKAFAMRGGTLKNTRWSWGGIRPSDGVVVFTVWQDEIEDTASGYE